MSSPYARHPSALRTGTLTAAFYPFLGDRHHREALAAIWALLQDYMIAETRAFCREPEAQWLHSARVGSDGLLADELDYTTRKHLGPFDAVLEAKMLARGHAVVANGGDENRYLLTLANRSNAWRALLGDLLGEDHAAHTRLVEALHLLAMTEVRLFTAGAASDGKRASNC